MQAISEETAAYRLGPAKAGVWIAFAPSGHDLNRTWQMQVSLRARGGAKTLAVLLQTTALRPLATVAIRGQSYPLTIGWHERRRGGVMCFGGERKLGQDGCVLVWEMRWKPDPEQAGALTVETRLQTDPRRVGDLTLSLHAPLHRPDVWTLGAASLRGHCAQTAHSAYSRAAVQFVALEEDAGWDDATGSFSMTNRRFSFGGGKLLRFGLGFLSAAAPEETRPALVSRYVALAESRLHPLDDLPEWQPAAIVPVLKDAGSYAVRGAERLYLNCPAARAEVPETYYAGFPHYPLDALRALWDWNRFHPADDTPRLVRYGATGIAADFQVMGRDGLSEPNKGAFWDKITAGAGSDYLGEPTHGIAANARIAAGLFRLHEALGEPLLRQSALNICQWLILKLNGDGYYDGERVLATRGLADDGRVLGQPCSLDGAEAIRPLVLAFRATRNEVFIKTAWKIAGCLLESRIREFDGAAPSSVAGVVRALAALDAEAPNAKLRELLRAWGAWLRALPLLPDAPAMNPDGLCSGLYDCAEAGFALFVLFRETAFLRYAFAALDRVPAEARPLAWRGLALRVPALLSVAALLPQARPDFGSLTVAMDWRIYAPDPATDQYIRVQAPDGRPVHALPLVCRQDDQLLLIVLTSRATECLSIFKNGRRPLVRDLLTGQLDSTARLHPLAGETWASAGLFTIDP